VLPCHGGIKDTPCRSNDLGSNAISGDRDDSWLIARLSQSCHLWRSRGTAHCIASRDPFVGALAAPASSAASLFIAVT
jgi:hypothetical protein